MNRCQPLSVLVYQLIVLAGVVSLCIAFDDVLKKVVCFFVFMSIETSVTFAVFALDKRRAENDDWRIPESTLHLLTAFFGIIGALMAMFGCHHKTSKPEFYRITIFLAFLNVVLYAALGFIIFKVA